MIVPQGVHRLVKDGDDPFCAGPGPEREGSLRARMDGIGKAGEFQRNLLFFNEIFQTLALQPPVFEPEEGERQVFGPVFVAREKDLLQRAVCARLAGNVNSLRGEADRRAGRVGSPEFRDGPDIAPGAAKAGLHAVFTRALLKIPFDRRIKGGVGILHPVELTDNA